MEVLDKLLQPALKLGKLIRYQPGVGLLMEWMETIQPLGYNLKMQMGATILKLAPMRTL